MMIDVGMFDLARIVPKSLTSYISFDIYEESPQVIDLVGIFERGGV